MIAPQQHSQSHMQRARTHTHTRVYAEQTPTPTHSLEHTYKKTSAHTYTPTSAYSDMQWIILWIYKGTIYYLGLKVYYSETAVLLKRKSKKKKKKLSQKQQWQVGELDSVLFLAGFFFVFVFRFCMFHIAVKITFVDLQHTEWIQTTEANTESTQCIWNYDVWSMYNAAAALFNHCFILLCLPQYTYWSGEFLITFSPIHFLI